MPEFAGICGTSGRPCKLVWSSRFPSKTKVGTYPSELLPSRRTIWHASVGGGYNFTPSVTALGGTGSGGSISGLGFVDAFAGFGIFGTDVQTDTFRPKTQITIIFARTENRINIPHVLTRAELSTVNLQTGTLELDVGEYIFEAVAVTDDSEVVGKLWQQIIDSSNEDDLLDDYGQEEEQKDQQFRKLIELSSSITDNRLEGVVKNTRGIEYRLDNGGPKASSIFSLPGLGDLNTPNYRDGSSRKMYINVSATKNNSGVPEAFLQPGDIIYLTYVAIKEHYIRQVVNISWSFVGQSLPAQCYPIATTIRAANYRFYEWKIDNNDPQGLPLIVGGWRAVESFNCPVNSISIVPPFSNPDIGVFIAGPASGQTQVSYLPRKLTWGQLDSYISNNSTLPQYTMFVNESGVDGASYVKLLSDEYKKTNWYLSGAVSRLFRYSDIIRHVFYNVHPKSLNKRDVDKFAFERSLATALEEDIGAGRKTFLPFYDGSDDITTEQLLDIDSSNTKFEPIQPITSAFFAEMQCGSVGGTVLFPAGGPSPSGDILAYFQVESPIITERFADDTRILVERHFTTGQVDPAIVAIEGTASSVSATTCIGDPSGHYGFVVHSNDSFLRINDFNNGYLRDGMRQLNYRPDNPTPLTFNNIDPNPTDYEKYIGFTGMLGDKYGFHPGRFLSISHFAPKNAFVYKSTNKTKLANILDIKEEDIKDLSVEHVEDRITIQLGGPGLYGMTELEYSYIPDDDSIQVEVLAVFKNGSSISSVIDSVDINKGNNLLRISHFWLEGSTLEFVNVPKPGELRIIRATAIQLSESYATDLLNNKSSSTPEDAASNLIDRLEDRSVLIESEVMSIGEDENSRLFVFFNDKENGISCLESDDFGKSWYFYYGICEPIDGFACSNPFVVQSFERNKAWLFFQFMDGKIMCKQIDYALFNASDANLIEKTDDILQVAENQSRKSELGLKDDETLIVELQSKYSPAGIQLRRKTISYLAAGDANDTELLKLTGRDVDKGIYSPFEKRINDSGKVIVDYKYPVQIGPTTAFTNKNIDNIYFSAYRNQSGEMRLGFLAPTKPDSKNTLQIRSSNDNGVNWYDLWEFVQHGFNRLRHDPSRKTQYIDTASDGSERGISGVDTQLGNQDAEFGVNIHWSRLKRHKILISGQEPTIESDSEIMSVSAPYMFYHTPSDKVYLFYIYENCLLCKSFSDNIFAMANSNRLSTGGDQDGTPMSGIKNLLERGIRAEFVDGDLNSIKDEVHYFYNDSTNERLLEGNIVFRYPQTIGNFNSDRSIPVQRVCSYALKNGNIRVFYKNHNGELRASIWDGNTWIQEDLMRDSSKLTPMTFDVPENEKGVTGGFGSERFGE